MTFGPELPPEEQWRRLRIMIRVIAAVFVFLVLLLIYGLWTS